MLAQVLTPSLHAKYNEDFTFRYTRDSQNINRRLGEDLEASTFTTDENEC